jgi:hypothetical protein
LQDFCFNNEMAAIFWNNWTLVFLPYTQTFHGHKRCYFYNYYYYYYYYYCVYNKDFWKNSASYFYIRLAVPGHALLWLIPDASADDDSYVCSRTRFHIRICHLYLTALILCQARVIYIPSYCCRRFCLGGRNCSNECTGNAPNVPMPECRQTYCCCIFCAYVEIV